MSISVLSLMYNPKYMVGILEDTSKVEALFEGWEETLIWSCLQKVMGKVFVTDLSSPESAMAYVGCFAFYAGEPDRELVQEMQGHFVIMVPQDERWASLIEECFPSAKKVMRYAIKKDTVFDKEYLDSVISALPSEYELRRIDGDLYDLCLSSRVTMDFVSAFGSKESYLELGRGVVILKDGQIVSGASSYTRYKEGIELEVETIVPERRKGLATIACAALIRMCLEEGLYPSWDAHDMNSVALARRFGYELSHEYAAYEVLK